MYTYTCLYIYICIYTYTYIYTHIYICIHINYIHASTQIQKFPDKFDSEFENQIFRMNSEHPRVDYIIHMCVVIYV